MRGFTLIEVVVSVLIVAMAVMASFSVVLSSFVSGAKADKKQEAATIMRYASETLKTYVSADENLLPGGGKWSDDISGEWALYGTAGGFTHDITLLLTRLDPDFTFGTPRWLRYTVSNDVDCGPTPGEYTCKKVLFTFSYNE